MCNLTGLVSSLDSGRAGGVIPSSLATWAFTPTPPAASPHGHAMVRGLCEDRPAQTKGLVQYQERSHVQDKLVPAQDSGKPDLLRRHHVAWCQVVRLLSSFPDFCALIDCDAGGCFFPETSVLLLSAEKYLSDCFCFLKSNQAYSIRISDCKKKGGRGEGIVCPALAHRSLN